MAKKDYWRIDISVEDDMLDWDLSRNLGDDNWEVVDTGSGPVVSDILHDAGRELELFLPEWFA